MSPQTAFNSSAVVVLWSSRNASVAAAVSTRRRQEPHFHVQENYATFQAVYLSTISAVRGSHPPWRRDGNGSLSFQRFERLAKKDALLRVRAQQPG